MGDLVIARNDVTGETTEERVLALHRNTDQPLWRLTVTDALGVTESFEVTDEHPFRTTAGEWVPALDLRIGDGLQSYDGRVLTVVSREPIEHGNTYKLSIAYTSTYFVGTSGVWVHNQGPCPWGKGAGAAKGAMWTSTKSQSVAENAFRHFKDHGADFGAKNAVDYVRKAQDFLHNPAAGVLSKTRANGDVVRFDPATNAFV